MQRWRAAHVGICGLLCRRCCRPALLCRRNEDRLIVELLELLHMLVIEAIEHIEEIRLVRSRSTSSTLSTTQHPVDFDIHVNRSFVNRFYDHEFEPQFRSRCSFVAAEDPRMLLIIY
ncbi:unnamed protein product [Heligmosomoides polygyrus]|uniref:Secreted protein n=1 Tax=Heligmosomoides polygyrus TaxID=6339 RepID=A0A183GKG6_HELPZ|nr:unnamed protein product [Heligmosomoides polygyrus]